MPPICTRTDSLKPNFLAYLNIFYISRNSDKYLDVMVTTDNVTLMFAIDFELAVLAHGSVAEIYRLVRLDVPTMLRKLTQKT